MNDLDLDDWLAEAFAGGTPRPARHAGDLRPPTTPPYDQERPPPRYTADDLDRLGRAAQADVERYARRVSYALAAATAAAWLAYRLLRRALR